MKTMLRNMTLAVAATLAIAQGAVSTTQGKAGLTKIETDVRHELVMLPWFGVFDNLEFQVADGGKHVILSG